ncbi:hypothetical protein DQ354_05890 [Arthrobacter sp. AQ5-06]|nr:hypothetical protein DQ354_05890 [Arthrobacter sp. AQ5-06]
MTPALDPAAGIVPAAGYRHLVGNALALYCLAMDDHDAAAAGRLLGNARLHFRDQPMLVGTDSIVSLYTAGFRNPAPTRHLISNLLVQADGPDIAYQARYQRWSLAGPKPTCETVGEYRGLFTPASKGWVWSEHRVLQS